MVELLRKAIEWWGLLDAGEASNQADVARAGKASPAPGSPKSWASCDWLQRSRSTSSVHAHMIPRLAVTERALRPIAGLEDLTDQKAKFQELIEQAEYALLGSSHSQQIPMRETVPGPPVKSRTRQDTTRLQADSSRLQSWFAL